MQYINIYIYASIQNKPETYRFWRWLLHFVYHCIIFKVTSIKETFLMLIAMNIEAYYQRDMTEVYMGL